MKLVYALLILALLLAGCGSLPTPLELFPTPAAQPEPTSTSAPEVVETPHKSTSGEIPVTPPTLGPLKLQVWLPPEFDPGAGSPEANLLQARLKEFSSRMPDVTVEVRVKDVDGPGGLLDTLTTANKAAQLALPDLVLLPHDRMEYAVQQGLLYPFDNLSSTLDDPDWFPFAREMARLQNKNYGLPFAADALIQVFRSNILPEPPVTLGAAAENQSPIIFPAADLFALYPLAIYQALGGEVRDEQGQAFLDPAILKQVFTFLQQASKNGVFPFWLTGLQNDEQSWGAFRENQGDQVLTWSSRYLRNPSTDISLASLPASNGSPFTLGKGWMWVLTSPDPSHHPASVKLAEFLTESNFLTMWSENAGYIPPRPGALQFWKDQETADKLLPVAQSLHTTPPVEILERLGAALEKATVNLLKQQVEPAEAAQQAADGLK